MSNPADKVATYEDLFNIPDNEVGEILAGELTTHPRPAPKHARAASILGARLLNKFDSLPEGESGDWWIFDEPECHLAEDIVVPDIAGWRKATMPELPDSAWFEIRPDWVCEVLSPSTAKYDRGIKREIYARERVGYYWIVDPTCRSIEVFKLNDNSWTWVTTAQEDQNVNLVPFESMAIDLSLLWV